MKVLIPVLSVLFYSTVSFAGYKCTEKDSNFQLSVDLAKKATLTLNTGVILKGHTLPSDSELYEVEKFKLEDADGSIAQLSISTISIMSRIPNRRAPCTGRICEDNYYTEHISAELDYLGKVTAYACQKTH